MASESPPALPTLPIDVLDPLLALLVQRAAVTSLWDPHALTQPLNAISRSTAPLPTKVALMHLPHVDLDFATQHNHVALLSLMLAWSKLPHGRPLQFTQPITKGMRAGALKALDWWLDTSNLVVPWPKDALGAACGAGHTHVLDWWRRRGYPHMPATCIPSCVYAACSAGHVAILDWLLEHMSREALDRAASNRKVMVLAAASGHTRVLDWWITKAQANVLAMPALGDLVALAFETQQMPVLTWCQSHPETLVHHHVGNPDRHTYNSALAYATRAKWLDPWIDALGIVPFACEYLPATQAACTMGDLHVLMWLAGRGWVRGSQLQQVCWATEAGNVQVLEWIHQYTPATGEGGSPAMDPYRGACKSGRVAALAWLEAHGYGMQPDDASSYFAHASRGCTEVLDWLVAHAGLTNTQLWDIGVSIGVETATVHNNLPALDWWRDTLVKCTPTEPACSSPRTFLAPAMVHPDSRTLDWWVTKAGPLAMWMDLSPSCISACGSRRQGNPIPGLNLWRTSGRTLDFAACIHAASLAGNLPVLDWFLHVAGAPEPAFVKALTCPSFNRGVWDFEHHGARALLWFWANVPGVCGHDGHINRHPGLNPIDLHLVKRVLKHATVRVPDACEMADAQAMHMYVEANYPARSGGGQAHAG